MVFDQALLENPFALSLKCKGCAPESLSYRVPVTVMLDGKWDGNSEFLLEHMNWKKFIWDIVHPNSDRVDLSQ